MKITCALFACLTAFSWISSQPPVMAAEGAAKGPAKTVRLLTIGNSFSANATRYLIDLAKADGNTLIHRPIVVGGASLELHAGKMQAYEKDSTDKAGLYTNGKGLKEQLKSDRWDFVTIQQASIKSHDLATYQPFANQLRDYVKLHAPQAELLLHQTWEYRVDDPRFTKPSGKAGEPKTQEEMYQMLTKAYVTVAGQLGIRRLPVGDAFHIADTDAKWGFRAPAPFDPKSLKAPELPDQTHSLHTGWQWKAQKDGSKTLGMDGHHATFAGQYLGACVWYEVIFGANVVGNKFVPRELDATYARFLQETAHRAVEEAQVKKAMPKAASIDMYRYDRVVVHSRPLSLSLP
jgi:hypothetical protein